MARLRAAKKGLEGLEKVPKYTGVLNFQGEFYSFKPISSQTPPILSIQGRKVQLTLRDRDENALLARMESLLTRFPEETSEADVMPEGWYPIHEV